jgi:hypothetical protein
MLGYVRNKYSQIPIPGAEVTLNGDTLITSAQTTKDALIDKLENILMKLQVNLCLKEEQQKQIFLKMS